MLKYEKVETGKEPTASIIWLHGLGASGHDFIPIVPELDLPDSLPVRFIFPHAPSIPVTVNGGMVMPAWYDILSMSIEREIDLEQIQASSEQVKSLIKEELHLGIKSNRIILAGFSQGGAVVYEAGLSFERPLGGLMCMSTYFATEDTVKYHDSNKRTPIFISHGTLDPVVPEQLGKKAEQLLIEKKYLVEYKHYQMEHSVSPDQVNDLSAFIRRCLV